MAFMNFMLLILFWSVFREPPNPTTEVHTDATIKESAYYRLIERGG